MNTTDFRLLPGFGNVLGATYLDGIGINFAVASTYATKVSVWLFDRPEDRTPAHTFDLTKHRVKFPDGSEDDVWHALCVGLEPKPFVYYTIHAHGPYDPAHGLRFNGGLDLVDPYTRGVTGSFRWINGEMFAPKCIAYDNSTIDWQGFDKRVRRESSKTIIAEMHIAGFTRLLVNDIGEFKGLGKLAGTYLGAAQMMHYLAETGYTAVEVMPIAQGQDQEGDRLNDWLYMTVAFAAPHAQYATDPNGAQRFETMIWARECHRCGLEILEDVVFNHTAEGNHDGPTYSFRGLDNQLYFFLKPDEQQFYLNWTGCGNTVNCNLPRMARLILDVMRLKVREYKFDGFRFDLAKVFRKLSRDGLTGQELKDYCNGGYEEFKTLVMKQIEEAVLTDPVLKGIRVDFSPKGRNQTNPMHAVTYEGPTGGFVPAWARQHSVATQDSTLAGIKVVAEPWDCTGNVSGSFSNRIWLEWYDVYRRSLNQFWAMKNGFAEALFNCIDGSREKFPRGPEFKMPVGYFASHDGQTGLDTCMYEKRHNEANGDGNTDGPDPEGFNCWQEGETGNEYTIRLRWQMLKNKFCMLLLSFVVPMILLGDEVGWTKKGNCNTWCQKLLNNFPWHLVLNNGMRRFVRLMIAFRNRHELGGREVAGYRIDRHIVKHDTTPLKEDAYGHYTTFIAGEILPFDGDTSGEHVYFAANAWTDAIQVTLPVPPEGKSWYRFVDTSCHEGQEICDTDDQMVHLGPEYSRQGTGYWVQKHSMIVLVSR